MKRQQSITIEEYRGMVGRGAVGASGVRGRHQVGVMNATEARYAQELEALKLRGEIRSWAFESLRFRLAEKTFYTPDFLVERMDGGLEIHEVKGVWYDDARAKIKIAAQMFPMFAFVAVKAGKRRGNWVVETFRVRV
jgi:hypothetical protein